MSEEFEKLAKDLQTRRTSPYEVITLKLDTARDNERIPISGNFIAIDQSSSSSITLDIGFNDSDASKVRVTNDVKIDTMFMNLYVTHSAQSGKTAKIIVGVKEFFDFFFDSSSGGSISALGDIDDVDLTGISTDDFIKWNGTKWVPVASSTTVNALGDITNVTITAIASGEIIKWSGSAWINNTLAEAGISAVGHTHAIDDLSDIVITTPADNEVLAYDNGTGDWINQTHAEAGLSSVGHTHVEADITDLGAYITGITAEPLSDLSDVTITSIASGEILKWNGSAWINNTLAEAGISAVGHSHAVTDLSDVTITAIASGEILKWNGSAWINNTLAEAGISATGHTHTESDITDLGSYLENIIEDTTPELGGELDCGAHSIGFTAQSATGDGTTTIDWKLGNKFNFTFGAFNETFTFTAPTNPCSLVLKLVQDGTGSRTATWPATVKWPSGTAPTLSTGANDVDVIAFYFDGTNYYGTTSLDFS